VVAWNYGSVAGEDDLAALHGVITRRYLVGKVDIWITRLYLGKMEVQLSPEQEAQLAALAAQEGRTPDDLAREVFGRALAEEARFVEAVKRGLASLDRGEYISHQDVGARIERLFQS